MPKVHIKTLEDTNPVNPSRQQILAWQEEELAEAEDSSILDGNELTVSYFDEPISE